MKQGTSRSPKVARLARRLDLSRRETVGLLNLLWEWAWEQAPEGDVGRWQDEDIAEACGESADRAGEVVAALLEAGWLDECSERRLLIHDYPEHCPEFVQKRLDRRGLKPLIPKGSDERRPDCGRTADGRQPDGGQSAAERRPGRGGEGTGRDGRGEPRAPEPADEEENPHPPAEPPPPETRTPAQAQHDELTGWVVRRLRQARGGTDEARPPTQGELKRLAGLIRPLGGRAIQVVERYADDEHPSTAAKTVRELLGCWDRMRGLVDRPPPKRTDEQLAKTLALGRSDGRERPLTEAEQRMLDDCACGHQGMKHRGATGGGACRICECERFTRTRPEPSTSDAGPTNTEPARAAGRSR